MIRSRLLANLLAAILCFLFVYATSSDGQEPHSPDDTSISYVATCWDELSPEVREGILAEFLALPRIDYLAESAVAFVQEEEDFMPTEIMGPVRLIRNGPEQMLAFREGIAYVMSPPGAGMSLHPGLYWTKGFRAWTVILPNGDDATYWVDREL